MKVDLSQQTHFKVMLVQVSQRPCCME